MEYRVVVNDYGTFWYKPGTDIRHRENGPAIEYEYGIKEWYLDGVKMTEKKFLAKTQSSSSSISSEL